MTVTVALKAGSMPRDIEGFPAKCERSVQGSLPLTSSFKEITTDELAWIKANLPTVYEEMHVLPSVLAAPVTQEQRSDPGLDRSPSGRKSVAPAAPLLSEPKK